LGKPEKYKRLKFGAPKVNDVLRPTLNKLIKST
jgi:hypothetical protein